MNLLNELDKTVSGICVQLSALLVKEILVLPILSRDLWRWFDGPEWFSTRTGVACPSRTDIEGLEVP
jgi:hypothetical protein